MINLMAMQSFLQMFIKLLWILSGAVIGLIYHTLN